MQIPAFLRSLFDIFPLVTYCDETHTLLEASERLSLSHPEGLSHHQQQYPDLLVHKVRPLGFAKGVTKMLPTDPSGLMETLQLCLEHNLVLPSHTNRGHGLGLVPSSYLASPSKELPMNFSMTKERIMHARIPFDSDEKSKSGPLHVFISEYLDSLTDLWILSLLAIASQEDLGVLGNLFTVDHELQSKSWLRNLILSRLSHDIKSWDRFAQRHSHLFTASGVASGSAQTWSSQSSKTQEALKKEYAQKLAEFQSFVPLFLFYSNATEDSKLKTLLELKFASFVICAEYFLPSEHCLSSVCKDSMHDALIYSRRVLMSF